MVSRRRALVVGVVPGMVLLLIILALALDLGPGLVALRDGRIYAEVVGPTGEPCDPNEIAVYYFQPHARLGTTVKSQAVFWTDPGAFALPLPSHLTYPYRLLVEKRGTGELLAEREIHRKPRLWERLRTRSRYRFVVP